MKRSLTFLLVLLLSGTAAAQNPPLCTLTGNISAIFGLSGSSTGQGVRVSYEGVQAQSPSGIGGSIVPGGSACSVFTDINGNLPTTGNCVQFLQGALVQVTIGDGQPTQIQIPTQSSADLSTLILANTDPPSIVTSITVAPGGQYVLTVTNPAPGTVGQAVLQPGIITGFAPVTCPSPSILVGEGNGNAVSCAGGSAVSGVAQAEISNTDAGGASQAVLSVGNGTHMSSFGILGTGWTPASPYNPNETYVGGNSDAGLLLYGQTSGAALHMAANAQGAHGTLDLTEDSSGDFIFSYPAILQFSDAVAGAALVENYNSNSAGYAQFEPINNVGATARLGVIGSAYAGGAPYNPNVGWVDSNSTAGLLLYGVGGPLHLAANGEGGVGTLDVTEDGSANFGLTSPGYLLLRTGADVYLEASGNAAHGNLAINEDSSGDFGLTVSSGGDLDMTSGRLILAGNTHFISNIGPAAAPSITASATNCGSTGSISASSTDVAGTVTVGGTVSAGSCIVNFGTNWASAPRCFTQPSGDTSSVNWGVGTSTSAMTVNTVTGANLSSFAYFCISAS